MTETVKPKLWQALIPIAFLIALLSYNVIFVFEDDALSGSNQIILLLSAAVAAIIGIGQKVSWKEIRAGITHSVSDTVPSLLILLLIGSLAGTWLISGIVPAMIYYGLQILSPEIFLPATCIICAVVSIATGSSWSTVATVGIALLGIGQALGINEAVVGGAIISGAYFGDKISPLSDTTNLAPAMAGTDLFTHIRYMLYTTVPSVVIALILYTVIGFTYSGNPQAADISGVLSSLDQTFNISPWLFLVPALVIFLIVRRIPALPSLLAGTLLGGLFAYIFQPELLTYLAGNAQGIEQYYRPIINAMTVETTIPSDEPMLAELLSSGGMSGMLGTIWLIICAMTFGGTMEACGFLQVIANAVIKLAKSTFGLIASTVGTCTFLNVTASDQYLAIVIPGRMYAPIYKERGLKPEVLSRSLEDSGTVTSVLIPWNTCGATQAGILGVATFAYAPFAFFNILSPIMTLFFAAFNIKIRRFAKGE